MNAANNPAIAELLMKASSALVVAAFLSPSLLLPLVKSAVTIVDMGG